MIRDRGAIKCSKKMVIISFSEIEQLPRPQPLRFLLLGCQRCWQLSLSLIPKVGLFLENKPYTWKFGLCLYDIPSVQQFVKFFNSERVAYCYNDLQQVIARLKFFFWCIFYEKYSAVADYFVLSMQLTFIIEDGPRFQEIQLLWVSLWH